MRRVLNIRIKGGLVFKLHDATECVAFSSRRNVGAHVVWRRPIFPGSCDIFRALVF